MAVIDPIQQQRQEAERDVARRSQVERNAWARPPILGREPTRLERLVRRARRVRNEFRSVFEERLKKGAVKAWPVKLNLYHTTICNLRCVMCEQAFGVAQEVMPPDVYDRVRSELFEHVSQLSLTVMGEPLCAPKGFIAQILADAETYDLRLELTTNATLFGPDEELKRLLRLSYQINVSIDGATAETYEAIRPPARWDRVVSNLDRMRRLSDELPFHQRPMVILAFVIMRKNAHELPDLVDLGARWGAHEVSASSLVDVRPSLSGERVPPDDETLRASVAEAARRATRHGIRLRVDGTSVHGPRPTGLRARARSRWRASTNKLKPLWARGFHFLFEGIAQRWRVAPRECPFLWGRTYALMDGNICTCCKHPDAPQMGSLKERSFQEIWNGAEYQALRTDLNTDRAVPACRDCYLLRSPR